MTDSPLDLTTRAIALAVVELDGVAAAAPMMTKYRRAMLDMPSTAGLAELAQIATWVAETGGRWLSPVLKSLVATVGTWAQAIAQGDAGETAPPFQDADKAGDLLSAALAKWEESDPEAAVGLIEAATRAMTEAEADAAWRGGVLNTEAMHDRHRREQAVLALLNRPTPRPPARRIPARPRAAPAARQRARLESVDVLAGREVLHVCRCTDLHASLERTHYREVAGDVPQIGRHLRACESWPG